MGCINAEEVFSMLGEHFPLPGRLESQEEDIRGKIRTGGRRIGLGFES
jgi:hypothetical protein